MYRAKRLFEKEGFIVIPYKVDYKAWDNYEVAFMNFLTSAGNLELIEIGIRKLIGRTFYLLKECKVFNKPSSVVKGSFFSKAVFIFKLLTI